MSVDSKLQVGQMLKLDKKMVVDERGNPLEVILRWQDFQRISELLGLDLDDEAIEDLRQAKLDRESGNQDAYLDLDSMANIMNNLPGCAG